MKNIIEQSNLTTNFGISLRSLISPISHPIYNFYCYVEFFVFVSQGSKWYSDVDWKLAYLWDESCSSLCETYACFIQRIANLTFYYFCLLPAFIHRRFALGDCIKFQKFDREKCQKWIQSVTKSFHVLNSKQSHLTWFVILTWERQHRKSQTLNVDGWEIRTFTFHRSTKDGKWKMWTFKFSENF